MLLEALVGLQNQVQSTNSGNSIFFGFWKGTHPPTSNIAPVVMSGHHEETTKEEKGNLHLVEWETLDEDGLSVQKNLALYL